MSDLWYVTNLRQIYGISSVQRPKKVKKESPPSLTGTPGVTYLIILTRFLVFSGDTPRLGLSEDYDTVPVVFVVGLNIAAVCLDGEAGRIDAVVNEGVNNCLTATL